MSQDVENSLRDLKQSSTLKPKERYKLKAEAEGTYVPPQTRINNKFCGGKGSILLAKGPLGTVKEEKKPSLPGLTPLS